MRLSGRLVDLGRLLLVLPRVEWERRFRGPTSFIPNLRRRARYSPERSHAEREVLRRMIAALDARLPGGGNCYRRALLEMSLDAGAARERLHLGLRAHGGPGSGHAWLASWPDAADASSYDAVLET